MKTKNLLLLISLVLFAGCASTKDGTKGVKSANATTLPQVVQIIQGPDRLRVIAYSDGCFNASTLTTVCSRQLNNAMKIIRSYGDGLIQVVGYTDDLYDPQTAQKIAQKQAEMVTSFLWLHGIGSQRLRTVGYGAHDFIASNRSVNGSSYNRRVEIILVKN